MPRSGTASIKGNSKAAGLLSALNANASLERIAVWLLVALAVLLRVRQYLFNRSLWLDEAMLAVNIVYRGLAGLLKPLVNNQSAPPGFLLVEKVFLHVFGNHDYVLRLFPLLASVAAILVMAWLARRVFHGWVGLLALGFFAFSWPATYYASELKQYGSDLLFSLIIVAAAWSCSAPGASRRHWLALLAAGTLGLWMSHPALFTIAAATVVLACANLLDKNLRHLAWLSLAGIFWLLNFICLYLVSLRHSAANSILNAYWHASFMPWPPWMDLGWFCRSGRLVMEKLLHVPLWLGAAVMAIGIFSLFRRDWKKAALLLLPVLGALAASGLEKYPFYTRFLLFAMPMFGIILAAGMQCVHELARRCFPRAGLVFSAAIVIMIFFQPVALSMRRFVHPENRNDIKPVMKFLSYNLLPQDVIYVHRGSRSPFGYYARSFGIRPRQAVIGSWAKKSAKKLREDVMKLQGRSRVWFLFASVPARNGLKEEKILLQLFRRNGVQHVQFSATGANVYLFDLSRSGQRPGFLRNSSARTESSSNPKVKMNMAMALKTR
jgi:hypothetical protein